MYRYLIAKFFLYISQNYATKGFLYITLTPCMHFKAMYRPRRGVSFQNIWARITNKK